jgi:hypothetical protein
MNSCALIYNNIYREKKKKRKEGKKEREGTREELEERWE